MSRWPNNRVIAYVYDADTHCRGCAGRKLGPWIHRLDGWHQVIFDTDERIDDLYCGTCHKLIAPSTISIEEQA